MGRGGPRGAVIAAGFPLPGMVGEAKSVGGERRWGASTRAGARASLGAVGRDGPVTGAAAKSAGFLCSQGSDLRACRATVPLAATHVSVGGEGKSHLDIVDVAGDTGGHGSGRV